jgi:hypothetical protein
MDQAAGTASYSEVFTGTRAGCAQRSLRAGSEGRRAIRLDLAPAPRDLIAKGNRCEQIQVGRTLVVILRAAFKPPMSARQWTSY